MKRVLSLLLFALCACGGGDTFFVRSRGADMPVWTRGAQTADTVVLFVHGGPGGTSIYFEEEPAFRDLEQDHRIAFWDQRGAGSSLGNAPPQTLTLEQYVNDLDTVVKVLKEREKGRRIVLACWSWGGTICSRYLGSRSAPVDGYIDVDGMSSHTNFADAHDWAVAKIREHLAKGDQVEHFQAELDWYLARPQIGPADVAQEYAYLFELGGVFTHPENNRGIGSLWINSSTPFDGLGTLSSSAYSYDTFTASEELFHVDVTPDLARITKPTLVLWAAQDGVLPLSVADQTYAALNPAIRSRVTIDDAAHEVLADQPKAFADAVRAFTTNMHE